MVLSPNSKTVSSGSYDGKVKLWDVGPGKVVAKWIRHAERMLSACWSVDGNRVGSGSYDGRARVWDVKSVGCQERQNNQDWAQGLCRQLYA